MQQRDVHGLLALVQVCIFAPPLCVACSPAASARVQCELDALKILPSDPMQATVYDAVDVINRVRACRAPDVGHHDGGSP